jgi:hypothetical protein
MDDAREMVGLSKGVPDDPIQALFWVARAVNGFGDHRTAHFARDRQRLVVFKSKRRAAERARRETNESWSGKVRAVRIICQ